jgi:hypothetical protein
MNSDSPTLPEGHLRACFEALSGETDVAIGPCADGGYYLLGTRKPIPRLTRDVRMSTPHVSADTLALAAEEGLRVHLLPGWYDVDDARTLTRLVAELANAPKAARHTRRFLEHHRLITEEQIWSVSTTSRRGGQSVRCELSVLDTSVKRRYKRATQTMQLLRETVPLQMP